MKIGDRIPLTETEQEAVREFERRRELASLLMLRAASLEKDAAEALVEFLNASRAEMREWRGIVSEDGMYLIITGREASDAQ